MRETVLHITQTYQQSIYLIMEILVVEAEYTRRRKPEDNKSSNKGRIFVRVSRER